MTVSKEGSETCPNGIDNPRRAISMDDEETYEIGEFSIRSLAIFIYHTRKKKK